MSKNISVSLREAGRQADIVAALKNPNFGYTISPTTARSLRLASGGGEYTKHRGVYTKVHG